MGMGTVSERIKVSRAESKYIGPGMVGRFPLNYHGVKSGLTFTEKNIIWAVFIFRAHERTCVCMRAFEYPRACECACVCVRIIPFISDVQCVLLREREQQEVEEVKERGER